jgi:hypothetical protein
VTVTDTNRQKITTKQLAVCGVFLAVSVVLLYLASIIPGLDLTVLAVAGALVYLISTRVSVKAGRIFFTASVLIALIVAPGKVLLLPYIFCFGPYGALKNVVEKRTSAFFDRDGDRDGNRDGASNGAGSGAVGGARSGAQGKRKPDDFAQRFRLSDEPISQEEQSGEKAQREKQPRKHPRMAIAVIADYAVKLILFAALVAICTAFTVFVTGVPLQEVLSGGEVIGTGEKTLGILTEAVHDLAIPLMLIGTAILFVLYDIILNLIDAVFGRYITVKGETNGNRVFRRR